MSSEATRFQEPGLHVQTQVLQNCRYHVEVYLRYMILDYSYMRNLVLWDHDVGCG